MHTYAFILGSHAKLSFAELKAVLDTHDIQIERHEGVAFVTSTTALEVGGLMQRLGGTVKIAEVVGEFDEERLIDWIYEHIDTNSKFHFGFSLYAIENGIALKKHWKVLHTLGLVIKKALKSEGISARFVESKEVALSSVIVHKERLLKNGVDVVLFKRSGSLLFGKTLVVQPFQEFSKRDYGRPSRDAHSGMLPPKLARMMVNLAQPAIESLILDPFCGSGTVLQEALLMGFDHLIGSDISEKAITDTKNNLDWLRQSEVSVPNIPLHVASVELLNRSKIVDAKSIDRIIFEGYLGPSTPKQDRLDSIMKELTAFYRATFEEFSTMLNRDGRIVAALPFWKKNGKEYHLNLEKIIGSTDREIQQAPLLYRRPQSVVGREIIIIQQ